MGLLSSIGLPQWLMIAAAVLIAMGIRVLHLPGARKLRLVVIHRLYHARRCRRSQGLSPRRTGHVLFAMRVQGDHIPTHAQSHRAATSEGLPYGTKNNCNVNYSIRLRYSRRKLGFG
jgi:hypothetical protein